MALSTKGWRRIVVESQIFYWQAESSAGGNLFQARPEIEPHRHLIVTCSQCSNQSGGFFRGATPGIVRVCIESAVKAGWVEERPILRSVAFSDPWRCVALVPSWLTSTVLALASQMDENRDFSPMPILADALQDAGCDNDDILNHCRQPGEHVWGCWVVDLLTGRK
jgi:hypothetical protein